MWIVKGLFLGLSAFIGLSITYVVWRLRPLRPQAATGVDVLALYTIRSPLFWLGLVVIMAAAFSLAHRWWAAA